MSGEVGDLEQAIDALYGAPLEDFVAERTRLAKELRAAGNRDDADTVAKLRKPSVAAWVLNQLARQGRRDVDLLLDAGHRLREAQAGVLRGSEKEAFERARKTEGDALRRLTREAEKLLSERGGASGGTLAQVGESLRAAAISPSGRELLARGRFVQPLQASGFDVVTELAAAASPPVRPKKKPPDDREKQREAREAVRAAKERLREAERQRRTSEQAAEAARRRADEDEARVRQAEADLDAAEAQLRRSTR